jgi:hypothetical protein
MREFSFCCCSLICLYFFGCTLSVRLLAFAGGSPLRYGPFKSRGRCGLAHDVCIHKGPIELGFRVFLFGRLVMGCRSLFFFVVDDLVGWLEEIGAVDVCGVRRLCRARL